MKTPRLALRPAILAALAGALFAMPVTPERASAAGPYTYLPTESTTDGRFLVMDGSGLETLAGLQMSLEFASPAGSPDIEIGIFDGDSGGLWDESAVPLEMKLYADPLGNGTGAILVHDFNPALDPNAMPDNAWHSVTIPNQAAAQAASGHYFYVLRVVHTDPNVDGSSLAFKARTNGSLVLLPGAFSFMVPVNSDAEMAIIHPNWLPAFNPNPTNYDGTWDFYLDVSQSLTRLDVWDGDLDFGAADGSTADTDDPDTGPLLPPWAVGTAAVPEGVASGSGPSTGNPPDDTGFVFFRRSPSVVYSLKSPSGQLFQNPNPSGNEEWEQFSVNTAPFDASLMDHHADSLPAGIYQVHMSGMDISNLNAWRFFHRVLGICNGEPCPTPRPFLVGDTVWCDQNGNQTQQVGEPGVANVLIQLLDAGNNVIGTTLTNGLGKYFFEVDPGTYTTRLAASNFQAGGALFETWPTTATSMSATVTNASVLTLDFGVYCQPDVPVKDPGDFGTRGFWRNWGNHFTAAQIDAWLTIVEFNSSVFGAGELFGDLNSGNLSSFMNPSGKTQQFKAGGQLLAAWLNTMNGSAPLSYVVHLQNGAAALYGGTSFLMKPFLLRSEELIVVAANGSALNAIIASVNETPS